MKLIIAYLVAFALTTWSSAQLRQGEPGSKRSAATSLVLSLAQDSAFNSQSAEFQSCLQKFPKVACTPLVATLKNEGKQTIVRFFTSCPGDFPGVRLKMPNGHWGSIPAELQICNRNMLEMQRLDPGQTYAVRFRLADPVLAYNLEYPPDDGLVHAGDQYIDLLREGAEIQAQWSISGCVASKNLKWQGIVGQLAGMKEPCSGGKNPQRFTKVIYSNDLVFLRGDSETLEGQALDSNVRPTFSIEVSGSSNVKARAPITVNITATNISNRVIAFDALSVAGERNFNIDVAAADGRRPPETLLLKAIRGEYQGPGPQLVLGGQLVQRDLAPGATLKWNVDVTKLYKLQPGTYTVRVWRPDWQMGHDLETPAGTVPIRKPTVADLHPASPPPKAIAKSNIVTFEVLP